MKIVSLITQKPRCESKTVILYALPLFTYASVDFQLRIHKLIPFFFPSIHVDFYRRELELTFFFVLACITRFFKQKNYEKRNKYVMQIDREDTDLCIADYLFICMDLTEFSYFLFIKFAPPQEGDCPRKKYGV